MRNGVYGLLKRSQHPTPSWTEIVLRGNFGEIAPGRAGSQKPGEKEGKSRQKLKTPKR